MFDYELFEENIVIAMKNVFKKWVKEKADIYILSLVCGSEMEMISVRANTRQYLSEQTNITEESYWYYKYCDEEWELEDIGGEIDKISSYMQEYMEENDEQFTNSDTFEYTQAFDEHCKNIINACKGALARFRQFINQEHPNLLLAFNIGEYFDDEERAGIFASVNNKEAAEEYAEHISDFN